MIPYFIDYNNDKCNLRYNACSIFQVSLVVLHSSTAVDALGSVLSPEMPLAHFSQFFCSHMRSVAMHRMALIYR